MGIIRFVLVGILAFILLRFLVRLIAEVRSFLSGTQGPWPRPREKPAKEQDLRDIKDATFEDVADDTKNEKPVS